MKIFNLSLRRAVLSLFIIIGLSLTSCGWKPSEEEINTLEETRAAALAAEKTQQEKKAEADALQRQVDAKKAELERVKAEKEKVRKALAEEAEASEDME